MSQGRNVDRINFLMASLSPAFISYDYDEEQWEDNCFKKMQHLKKEEKSWKIKIQYSCLKWWESKTTELWSDHMYERPNE